MITFYKHHNTAECLDCYETEMALKEMVVAHTVKLLDNYRQTPEITEGKKKIIGHLAIKKYITELEKTIELWRKFQSDSCYTDSDGKVC